MASACGLLEVELALDQLEAELASELPGHMRAFAAAYADGREPPAAPAVAHRAGSLAVARRALAHPLLADRGLALVRLLAPIAIEDDPRVIAARMVSPSWPALTALVTARDAAARARFDRGALELAHAIDGSAPSHDLPGDLGPWISAWYEVEASLDEAAIAGAWDAIAAAHEVSGTPSILRGGARARTFVVDRAEAIVVLPAAIERPVDRFAVLHELGHVVAAFALAPGIPRALDEAAASIVARTMETPGVLPAGWYSPHAAHARARRRELAIGLAAIEQTLLTRGSATAGLVAQLGRAAPEGKSQLHSVPWALWHDPGAQAAYVTAEAIADRLAGSLVPGLRAERERIDRAVVL